MTNKEIVLKTHRSIGRNDALALREKAVAGSVTDTQIIDLEEAVPSWSNERDYSNAGVGAPIAYEGQIYGLIQPHNAAHYPDTAPDELAALWRVKHTTDPAKAKPWVRPVSTSDMYIKGECMLWGDGTVRVAVNNTAYSPEEYPQDWEVVDI